LNIKIFLADDHTVVRDGMSALIEAERGIEVIGTAGDGREAVRQVENLRPDVVIMDIAMPEQNGIEATIQIQTACPSAQVIILSMHETKEHIFQALRAGARGYLLKESAGKEVVEAIRTVYKGQRYLSRRIEERVIEDYLEQRQAVVAESPLEKLSSREREILQLVVEGKTSQTISEILFVSPKTVETYRHRLMQKLGVKDMPGLVKFAIQHGLTTLDT
jgi:DNA-binding NarL/FixJ family response regulator